MNLGVVNEEDFEDENSFNEVLGVQELDPYEVRSYPRLDEWFGNTIDDKMDLVLGKKGEGEHLDHGITMVFRESFVWDGSKPNRTLRVLTHDNELCEEWCSPLLYFGCGKVAQSRACKDLGPSNLTLMVRAALNYVEKSKAGLDYFFSLPKKPAKKVTGVKVTAVQDGAGGIVPSYAEVDVPIGHPVFREDEGMKSAITHFLEFELRYWEVKGKWVETPFEVSSKRALPTAYLGLGCHPYSADHAGLDPDYYGFGELSRRQLHSTANTVIVRSDRKPLSALQVDAMCSFLETVAQPKMTGAEEKMEASVTYTKEQVAAYVAVLNDVGKEWLAYKRSLIEEVASMGLGA